jgi:hypothetical protein
MGTVVVDVGNWAVKSFNPDGGDGRSASFMHALARISETSWNQELRGDRPPKGFIRVNGNHYVVGESAWRHQMAERPKGAARYTEDYYGPLVAAALTMVVDGDDRNLTIACSYPPGDAQYAAELSTLVCRDWNIVTHKGAQHLSVLDAYTFDEPLGGYYNCALNKTGKIKVRGNRLAGRTTIVLDLGGHTLDAVVVNADGDIDFLGAKSVRGAGTIGVLSTFENELRAKYPQAFRDAAVLDRKRVEAAISRGYYPYGNKQLDCRALAEAAINTLVNAAQQTLSAAGGVANFDIALLTGGGFALIHEQMIAAVPDLEFVLAEDNPDLLQVANVRGGAKLVTLLEGTG